MALLLARICISFRFSDRKEMRLLSPNAHWGKTEGLSRNGYGTYILNIISPKEQVMQLWIPRITSASRLYLNGALVSSLGTLGRSIQEERGARRTKETPFF